MKFKLQRDFFSIVFSLDTQGLPHELVNPPDSLQHCDVTE